MKIKHLFITTICVIIIPFLLTSCSGYNSKMRNHLTNDSNYHFYRGTIHNIYYFDATKKVSLLSSVQVPDCEVVVELTFEDKNTIEKFLGGNLNHTVPLDEYKIAFKISKENNQILIKNGFYNVVTANTPIEIVASNYIYMDSDFFFIAAISYNNTSYLAFEDGIQNIKKHINDNKSLL